MPKNEHTATVLIVDDDPSVRRALARLLRSGGVAVQAFGSAEELLSAGDLLDPACAILDVHLPGVDGIELQGVLRQRYPEIVTFVMTAFDTAEVQRRALAGGARAFLRKPFEGDGLLAVVRAACLPARPDEGVETRNT